MTEMGSAAWTITAMVVGAVILQAVKAVIAWARKGRQAEEHANFVTHEEMKQAITAEVGTFAQEMEKLRTTIDHAFAKLAEGDGCFNDHERAMMIMLVSLDRICRFLESKYQEKLGCQELSRLVGGIHARDRF